MKRHEKVESNPTTRIAAWHSTRTRALQIDFQNKCLESNPVRSFRTPILYALLFVIGFLSLKNLLPGYELEADSNCQEFGHIHVYSLELKPIKNSLPVLRKQSKPADAKDAGDCHEAKSIFVCSPVPAFIIDFSVPTYVIIFDLVFALENNFNSPDLKLHRRPPKPA